MSESSPDGPAARSDSAPRAIEVKQEDMEAEIAAYRTRQVKRESLDGGGFRTAEEAKLALRDLRKRMENLENAYEPGSICHQEYLAVKNLYESWQLDNRLFTISEESTDDIKMEEILTRQERARQEKAKKDFFVIASLGQNFVKHGRSGKPHLKTVRVDTKTGRLFWGEQSIFLQDVTEIKRGKHTKVFDGVSVNRADPRVCFSIVAPTRTLDLQAASFNEREVWVEGLTRLQLKLLDDTPIDHRSLDSQSQFLTICQQGRNLTKWNTRGEKGTKLVHVNPISGLITCGSSKLYIQEMRVLSGKSTQVFEQVGPKVAEEVCFSLVHRKRTLDLSATSQIERDMWVKGLQSLQSSLLASKADLKKAAEARLTDDVKKKAAEFAKICTTRTKMYKFTRSSMQNKHKKWVTVDPDSGVLSWGNGSLNLKHVIAIELGKTTKVFQKVSAKQADPAVCFSVILPRYTLDLQCDTPERARAWVGGLRALKIMLDHKHEMDSKSRFGSGGDSEHSRKTVIPRGQWPAALAVLDKPCKLIKHGRHGRPHERTVRVDRKALVIDWGSGNLDLGEAYEVTRGKATKVFQSVTWRKADPALCFSIIWEDRTLDLQAPNHKTREAWVIGLTILLQQIEEGEDEDQGGGAVGGVPEPDETKAEVSQGSTAATGKSSSAVHARSGSAEGSHSRSSSYGAMSAIQYEL